MLELLKALWLFRAAVEARQVGFGERVLFEGYLSVPLEYPGQTALQWRRWWLLGLDG